MNALRTGNPILDVRLWNRKLSDGSLESDGICWFWHLDGFRQRVVYCSNLREASVEAELAKALILDRLGIDQLELGLPSRGPRLKILKLHRLVARGNFEQATPGYGLHVCPDDNTGAHEHGSEGTRSIGVPVFVPRVPGSLEISRTQEIAR